MKRHQRLATSHASPAPGASRSLRATLGESIAQLEREGVSSAALAAEVLLMHTLGRDRTWIYAHPEQELDAATRDRYFALVARRAGGVPTQYLTGRQEFWGLEFEVTPDVLIPRPETEHVIEVALERLGVHPGLDSPRRNAELQIVDFGTGSGCIAVALARELPTAHIIAIDISGAALAVARRNAARHSVEGRVDFIEGNLMDVYLRMPQTVGQASGTFDLIVSNPPYIAIRSAGTLPREVREHEPHAALFGGETGTELYAPIILQADGLLKPGGHVILELGDDCGEYVTGLLKGPEWGRVMITNDLAGIPRVVSAQRL